MKSVWIAAAAAIAAVASLSACGPNKAEGQRAAAVAGANGVTVTTSDNGRNVTVVQNGAAGGMPAFVPQYPGGTTSTTYAAVQNGRHGGVYAFTTADPADKVFEFYRSRAEAGGLETQTNVETGGSRIYGAQGPGGDLAVTAAPQDDGKTYVQVTWSAKG
jgi:hypothetical protein